MRADVVVLLSGGMDSSIAFLIAKASGRSVKGLYVDLGQPYRNKESRAVAQLEKRYKDDIHRLDCKIVLPMLGNVPTVEDQVIPGRNLTLAVLGANFGDEVWLCALDGEMHDFMPDKNKAFFEKTEIALTQAYGKPIRFLTPFSEMTKAELIKHALELGISYVDIMQTSTCYDPLINKCGECSACVKRWIALKLNGLYEKCVCKPEESSYASAYKASIRHAWEMQDFSHYSEKRIIEAMRAFNMNETPPLFPRDKWGDQKESP